MPGTKNAGNGQKMNISLCYSNQYGMFPKGFIFGLIVCTFFLVVAISCKKNTQSSDSFYSGGIQRTELPADIGYITKSSDDGFVWVCKNDSTLNLYYVDTNQLGDLEVIKNPIFKNRGQLSQVPLFETDDILLLSNNQILYKINPKSKSTDTIQRVDNLFNLNVLGNKNGNWVFYCNQQQDQVIRFPQNGTRPTHGKFASHVVRYYLSGKTVLLFIKTNGFPRQVVYVLTEDFTSIQVNFSDSFNFQSELLFANDSILWFLTSNQYDSTTKVSVINTKEAISLDRTVITPQPYYADEIEVKERVKIIKVWQDSAIGLPLDRGNGNLIYSDSLIVFKRSQPGISKIKINNYKYCWQGFGYTEQQCLLIVSNDTNKKTLFAITYPMGDLIDSIRNISENIINTYFKYDSVVRNHAGDEILFYKNVMYLSDFSDTIMPFLSYQNYTPYQILLNSKTHYILYENVAEEKKIHIWNKNDPTNWRSYCVDKEQQLEELRTGRFYSSSYYINTSPKFGSPTISNGGNSARINEFHNNEMKFDLSSKSIELTVDSTCFPTQITNFMQIDFVIENHKKQRKVWHCSIDRYSNIIYLLVDEFSVKSQISYGDLCSATLSIDDSYGNNYTWKSKHVVFKRPIRFIELPIIKAAIAFAILCTFIFFINKSPKRFNLIVRYVIVASSFIIPILGKYWVNVNPIFFLVLVVGGALFSIGAGIYSPQLFRTLSRIEPFKPLAIIALSHPKIRKRLFEQYITRFKERVLREKKLSNFENYTPVPFVVAESLNCNIEQGTTMSPPYQLYRILTTTPFNKRAYVLIEAPGGRGKSALLRETLLIAANEFLLNPVKPIPVFCDGKDSLFLNAKNMLGRDGFSEEIIMEMATHNNFFFVVDGISESEIKPQDIQKHISDFNEYIPILATSRPSKSIRNSIAQNAKNWIVVEPEKLNTKNLSFFVANYGMNIEDIPQSMLDACREIGNNYLPILVRLCLMADNPNVTSVRDIYSGVINRLLKENETLLDNVITLCHKTHWSNGSRRIRYATAENADRQILTILMSSGLVIPADSNPVDGDNPHTVRFFHDSMQSYLTARKLVNDNNLKNIQEAAGSPRFDVDETGISEVFKMCLYIYGNDLTLKKKMKKDIQSYSNIFAGAFSRNWIVEAARLEDLDKIISPHESSLNAVKIALNEINNRGDFLHLGSLYSRIIRKIWSEINAETESM